MKKHYSIFGLTLFLISLCAQAVEAIHDNLPAFDSSVREYEMIRPALFKLLDKRKVYVRRDKIELPGADLGISILSGTGSTMFRSQESAEDKAREDLDKTTFESVSGKSNEAISGAVSPFKRDPEAKPSSGVDFVTSSSLSRVAKEIYLKLPLSAPRFAAMGFDELRYVIGVKSDSEGVVLKNKDAIVMAFRGTEPTSLTDWITDINFFAVPLLEGESPQAHIGFLQASNELWPLVRAEIVSTFENKIRKAILEIASDVNGALELVELGIPTKVLPPDLRPIYLTGHSLGGAIATLIYGELTLPHLDRSKQGYYFSDPVLAQLTHEQVSSLLKLIVEKESQAAALAFDTSGKVIPRSFSLNEQDRIESNQSLSYLAVLQNESIDSATPAQGDDTITIDPRLRALTTFGAPRSMDIVFKASAERYATVTNSLLVRFENFHLGAERIALNDLKADLVPRVPGIIPGFTHVGIRASFKTDDIENFTGDPAHLECEYSSPENERRIGILDGHLARIEFSIGYHNMELYEKRVSSYLGFRSPGHSCQSLDYKSILAE